MTDFVLHLLAISLSGGVLALAIFLLKSILKKRASKAFMYYIWTIVLLRLILPFGIGIELPTLAENEPFDQSEIISETDSFDTESVEYVESFESIENAESSNNTESEESAEKSEPESEFPESSEPIFSQPPLDESFPPESNVADSFPENSQNESTPPVVGFESAPPSSTDKNTNANETISSPLPTPDEPKAEKTNVFFGFLKNNLLIIWALGFSVSIGWYVLAYFIYTRKLRHSFSAPNPADWQIFNDVCGRNRINLVMSENLKIPMQIGIFRPLVVLPKAEYAKNGLSEQLRFILHHELVHFERRDIIYKWITIFITSLHWFNPILYFVRREIAESCELACDEAVIKNLAENERQAYGNTLIALSAKQKKAPFGTAATLCESHHQLKERLVSIMKYKKVTKSAVCLMLVISLLLCGCAMTVLDVSESETSDETSVIESENENPDTSEESTESFDTENEESRENSENSNDNNDETLVYPWSDHKKWDITKTDEALHYFKAFLLGQRKFITTQKVSPNDADEYLITNFTHAISYSKLFTVEQFGLIDLDGDNVPELVNRLYTDDTPSGYLILRYTEGKLYGYYMTGEKYGELRSDGTILVSETETYRFIRRYTAFNTDGYEFENLAKADKNYSTSDPDDIAYVLSEKAVSVKEGEEYFEKHLKSPTAVWYDFDTETVEDVVNTSFFFPNTAPPENNLTDKEKAFDMFAGIMNGERKFRAAAERTDYKRLFFISEISDYVAFNIEKLKITDFAIVDFQQDDLPEIVNRITNENNELAVYQILKYYDGTIYSYIVAPDMLCNPKQDGTYYWKFPTDDAYGIADSTSFRTDGTIAPIRYFQTYENHSYFSDGVEFASVEKWQKEHTDAVWYEFNAENIKKFVSDTFTKPVTHGDAYELPSEGTVIETENIGNQHITNITYSNRRKTIKTETFENGQRTALYVEFHDDNGWLIGEDDYVFKNGIEVSRKYRAYNGNIVYTTLEEYGREVYSSTKNVDGVFLKEFKLEDGVTTTYFYRDGEVAYTKSVSEDRVNEHTELRDAAGVLLFARHNSTSFYYGSDGKVFTARYSNGENYSSFVNLSVSNGENPIEIGKFHYGYNNNTYELLGIESIGEGFTEESARAEYEDYAEIIALLYEVEDEFGSEIWR